MIILMSREVHGGIKTMVLQTLDESAYEVLRKWLMAELPQKLTWEVVFWTNDVHHLGFDGWGSLLLDRERVIRQPGTHSIPHLDFQKKAEEVRSKLKTAPKGIQDQLNETAPGVVLPSLEHSTEATVTKSDD